MFTFKNMEWRDNVHVGRKVGVVDTNRVHMPAHTPKMSPNVNCTTHKASQVRIKSIYINNEGLLDRVAMSSWIRDVSIHLFVHDLQHVRRLAPNKKHKNTQTYQRTYENLPT
jgi:hypothetical protein